MEVDAATLGHVSQVTPSIISSPNGNLPDDGTTGLPDLGTIPAELSGNEIQAVNVMPGTGTSFPVPQNSGHATTEQPLDDWSYPMYFENITMPQDFQINPEAPTQEIPDVARYMQDDDIWSNTFDFSNTNNLDFFNSNVFNFDTNLTPNPENVAFNAPNLQPQIADSPASIVSQNSLRARFDAFRRSPWYVLHH